VSHILDTCVFLWLALSPEVLPGNVRDRINSSERLFFSMAGVWEITFKNSAGKLPLPSAPRLWVPSRLAFYQIELLPMESEVVFISGELPRLHRDPFDRLHAAESIYRSLAIISPDEPISQLGADRFW
jgi:PIN domain nuclease of toxin-antitoxin system